MCMYIYIYISEREREIHTHTHTYTGQVHYHSGNIDLFSRSRGAASNGCPRLRFAHRAPCLGCEKTNNITVVAIHITYR